MLFFNCRLSQKTSTSWWRSFVFFPHIFVFVIGFALAYLSVWPNLETYNLQRFLQSALFLISALLFLSELPRVLDSRLVVLTAGIGSKILWVMLLVVLGAVGSILNSHNFQWALLDLEYLILCLFMVWFVAVALVNADKSSWGLMGCLALALMTLYAFRSALDIWIFAPLLNRLDATPGFANIRLFSDVAVVMIPLSWLAITQSLRFWTKFLLWAANIFWVWLLVVTEARSGLLSLTVAVCWVTFRYGVHGRKTLLVALLLVLVAVSFYMAVPVMAADGWQRDITSSSGRWELWQLAIQCFLNFFPFGAGGMAFAADGRAGVASPHNLILVLLAEWGFLFCVGLAIVLFQLWKRYWVGRRYSTDSVEIGVRIPVTIAAIAATVNTLFAGSHIAPFSALCLILAWGSYVAINFSTTDIRPRFLWVVPILFIALWLHVAWLGYSLYQVSEGSRAACQEEQNMLYPRFWIQGRLDCGSFVD